MVTTGDPPIKPVISQALNSWIFIAVWRKASKSPGSPWVLAIVRWYSPYGQTQSDEALGIKHDDSVVTASSFTTVVLLSKAC